jgi:thiol-disulfide isomerase/thioredoxin
MMKRNLLSMLVLFMSVGAMAQQQMVSNYEIKLKIKNTENDTVYLANYLGKKLYYYDTAYVDSKGVSIFKGKSIPAGVYAVVTKGPKYFEIVVNEPKIELETSTENFTKFMNVKQSAENKIFYEFITVMLDKRSLQSPLSNQLNDSTISQEKRNELITQIRAIDEEIKVFQKEFDAKYHSKYFTASLLSINFETEIPVEIDSANRYWYYRAHFLERIDFNDDRFVRSPAFHNKIEKYFTSVLPQIPDTICAEAQRIIGSIKNEKSDTWKYLVHFITNTFEQSKVMGMDRVLVCMGKKYYCADTPSKAYWMPEDKLKEMCDRINVTQSLLLGEKAPNLILQDSTEKKWVNLHRDIKSKWTILVFWDPNCGHCKKEIPVIQTFYEENKNTYDISIVAISTELENKDWKKYIRENNLTDWIHISDNPEIHNNPAKYLGVTTLESLNFRHTYDIYTTPQIYILDENKTIKAKKIGAAQLEDLFEKMNR